MTRTHLASQRLCQLLATVTLTLVAHHAGAFQVENLFLTFEFHGGHVHEEITRDAFRNVFVELSDGTRIAFTEAAVEEVVRQNALTDSVFLDEPPRHFDDELFAEGNRQLVLARTRIGRFAMYGSRDWRGGRLSLGMALHTLQDFYAHSTWVESHSEPLNLGDPNPNPPFREPGVIGPTCSLGGLISPSILTSGYFEKLQAIGSLSILLNNAHTHGLAKCIHGLSFLPLLGQVGNRDFVIAGSPSLPIILTGAGINKDGPKRDQFCAARKMAVVATTNFVNELLADADLHLDDAAKCGLLGHELDDSGKCAGENRAATIDFAGVDTAGGYTTGAAVAAYLAPFGVSTPNSPTVLDTVSYAPFIRSPTKNIMTGGDGRNPTTLSLDFQDPVTNLSFVRAGIVGALSPSGTIAGPWTATAYDASGTILVSVGEELQSFYGDRASVVFALDAQNISRIVFAGYDFGYAGINVPYITNITFSAQGEETEPTPVPCPQN